MRPNVIGGIQDRVDAFVTKCVDSGKRSLDVYVQSHGRTRLPLLTSTGLFTLLRTRLCIPPPLPPLWNSLYRTRRGPKTNARAFLLPHHQKSIFPSPFTSLHLTKPQLCQETLHNTTGLLSQSSSANHALRPSLTSMSYHRRKNKIQGRKPYSTSSRIAKRNSNR